VVIDLETTGLSVDQGDRVIEIGAVRVDDGETHTFDALVDPGRPIPLAGIQIHHITDELVEGQPSFADLWPALHPLLEGAVLVAHSASTDLGFLQEECRRAALQPLQPAVVVDTLLLARTVFGLSHCSLGALAARIGVPHSTPHRALCDAQATWHVYRAMLDALDPDSTPTVGELLRLTQSLGRGGNRRHAITAALSAAFLSGQNVVIDYTSAAGGALTTRREITITRLRLPYIEAHCHLRRQPRVFKITRIRRVLPVQD